MLLRLEDLTIEQKLGMVFCSRRHAGGDDREFTLELIKNHALGCVQIAPGPDKDERNRELVETADYPLLVFNDTESGFPTAPLPKVPPMSLAACDDDEYYRAFARSVVHYAKQSCFTGTWGPVIDVLRGDGPCRVHRHYSDDPMKVAKTAAMIAEVYRDSHFLSTGKHYPGAHDCPFDTHMTEGYSDITEEELIEFDLLPYLYLNERGLLPCIMTDHTVYRKIDPDYPASLSKKVIDIIRDRGFDGLCFTDSFAMMGILQKYGEENIYGMSIAAGNDIFLPNYRTPTRECYEMLLKNYRDGAFTEERLNEAVRRVLRAQAFVAEKPENEPKFTDADREKIYSISKDCITAVTEDGVKAELSEDSEDRLFVIVTENSFKPEVDQEIAFGQWYFPKRIAEAIGREFPKAGIAYLPEFPNAGDNDRLLTKATGYKEVVFITFCTTAAYLGTDALTKRVESVINCLVNSGKVSAIVHFGNPYALKTLLPVPRRIFGYMIPESQEHAIEVLSGKLEAKGHLPYDITE